MLRGSSITTVAQRFFDENATTIRPATRRTWTSHLQRLQKRCPDKRINEITAADLADFILKGDDGRPRRVSAGTMRNWRTCFRSFFSWCVYVEILEHDPSSTLLRAVRLKVQGVRQHTWLTEAEINHLLDVCRDDPDELRGKRDGIALGFGIFCGLRLHEIAKLKWGDLNLRAGTLSVIGKGGKLATLPVPPALLELLFEWQGHYAKGLGAPPRRDSCVLVAFQNLGGSPFGSSRSAQPHWGHGIGDSAVYKTIKERGAEVGIPELAPHDLRRSYAGILEDRGVPLRDISSVMRHSSIATTERYLADNPKKWQDSVSTAMAGLGMRSA